MSHLYYCNVNGKVSLAIDGVLRWLPNPEVYGRLFAGPIDPAQMTRYDSIAPIAEGQPLSVKAKLIKSSDDASVYLFDEQDGVLVRRHVVSAEMFVDLGLDWNKVEVQSPSQVNQVPLGRPCSLEKPVDAVAITFYSYNPVYQAQDGKPYTLTITDSSGRQVYSHSGTTNAGLDTHYGTTWGKDTVNMTIGQTYTVSVVVTNGGDVYGWTSAGFGVRPDMDPNIKILHNAYTRR